MKFAYLKKWYLGGITRLFLPRPKKKAVKGDNVLELNEVMQFPAKQMFRTFLLNVIASAL